MSSLTPERKPQLPYRRSHADGVFAPQPSRLMSEDSQIAANLRREGLSYGEIAFELGVSVIRARDLCNAHDRLHRLHKKGLAESELSKRAVTCLSRGYYALRVKASERTRLDRILEIAVCYTAEELMDEPNVGRRTLREIETWLHRKGLSFRSPYEEPAEALARLQKVLGKKQC